MMDSSHYRLMVKTNGRIVFLCPDDIHWIEAQGDYVQIHGRERKLLVRKTLGSLEKELPSDRFVRIHRSTLVAIDSIKEILPHAYGDSTVILLDGVRLAMTRSRRKEVFRSLQKIASL